MTRRVRIPWRLGLAVAALSLAVFVSTYWYTFTINLTGSLPGTFYVIHRCEDVGQRKDRKSTRLNSVTAVSRMPSSA